METVREKMKEEKYKEGLVFVLRVENERRERQGGG